MKTKAPQGAIVVAVSVALSLTAVSAEPANSQGRSPQITTVAPSASSMSEAQIRQFEIDAAIAPIKSKQDLQEYLATVRPGTSPLDALSFAAKQRFLASLEFNEKGLTTFEYIDLQNELTPTQVYKVLALFGMQRDTGLVKAPSMTKTDYIIMGGGNGGGSTPPGDNQGYRCESRGTCVEDSRRICTSNC